MQHPWSVGATWALLGITGVGVYFLGKAHGLDRKEKMIAQIKVIEELHASPHDEQGEKIHILLANKRQKALEEKEKASKAPS